MFKNFITLAYRNFLRSPLTSFIELFGMTAALTVFILVSLWLFNETGYDKFNEKSDRIYRLESQWQSQDKNCLFSTIIASILEENLPEIEKTVLFRPMGTGVSTVNKYNDNGEKSYYSAKGYLYTQQDFFDIFTFEFIEGQPENALANKDEIVITESLSKTIFGDERALGKILYTAGDPWKIVGVVKDAANFHIPFQILRSFATLADHDNYFVDGKSTFNGWSLNSHPTYVLVKPNQDLGELVNKMRDVSWEHLPHEWKQDIVKTDMVYSLRPLEDIYFNGGELRELQYAIHGDKKKVIAYSSIALFTLLLACLNFINLNTAKCLERVKEVGIKKVSGASRSIIILHFLGEVGLLCLTAMMLAVVFAHTFLPVFNELLNTSLSMNQILDPYVLGTLVFGLLIISLLSGGFPALYMSSFQPAMVVKGLQTTNRRGFSFKKVSLVAQFSLTTLLIIGSITAYKQLHHMRNADLGFSRVKEQRITFSYTAKSLEKSDVMKRILLSNPNIISLSHVDGYAIPGRNRTTQAKDRNFIANGIEYNFPNVRVDEGYPETLGLEIVKGRYFEKGRANDLIDFKADDFDNKTPNIVINETAYKTMNLEDPFPISIKWGDRDLRIIGVIKDYHINSVDHPIEPLAYIYNNRRYNFIAKISPHDINNTIQFIKTETEKKSGKQTKVEFLDDIYQGQYQEEDNFAQLTGYLTGLAIVIACMGLLGIASHAIKLRTKEIGIRKTMGASSFQILNLISSPFIKSIIISTLIAIPVGAFAMESWLSNYPYRIELSWWVFVIASALTLIISLFTIIWNSWRASSMNPARLIRYE